ncbi:IS5 family transposase [Leisingera sp. D0M16]|uniref:IS5 family transposase n=1 Tax=Leisingera coralii TaxID=3351347 RepID=UPI003B75EDDB
MARNLMSDEEWAFFERFIQTTRTPNGRKPTNHRPVLDGIFWIAQTGAPWRDLPEEFGKWSSVYRQFRRWTLAGLWEEIMEALNESGAVPDALQMIDSTVIRAHHQTAGAKGGLRDRVSGAQERPMGKQSTGLFSGPSTTSRPRSTSSSTRMVCP